MEKTFWMVWNEAPYGRPTVKHQSLSVAKKEAERLASENPGTRFVVLRAECAVKVCRPVEWTDLDEVPF